MLETKNIFEFLKSECKESEDVKKLAVSDLSYILFLINKTIS